MSDPQPGLSVGVKEQLHRKLRISRAALLSKLEGLSEYDVRRPMTPTGTNLLGLVKHLADLEYGYLGESFGRPAPEPLPWVEDGSVWDGADMWATADESSEYLVGVYRRACAHADQTIDELELEAPGTVGALARGTPQHDARRAADPDGRRDRPARWARRHHPGADRREGRCRP